MSHSTALPYRSIRRSIAVIFAMTMLVACANDHEIASPTVPASGQSERVFELNAIDGAELPYSIPKSSRNSVVTSGRLLLRTDHTYSFVVRYTRDGASVVATDDGSWTGSKSSIRFSGNSIGSGLGSEAAGGALAVSLPASFLSSSGAEFSLDFRSTTKGRHPL